MKHPHKTLCSALAVLLIFLVGTLPLTAQLPGEEEAVEPPVEYTMTDWTAAQVLDEYVRLTGRTILRAQNLPQLQVNFITSEPLDREEAIVALESLLALNGIAVVELGDKFMKAVVVNGVEGQAPELLVGEGLLERKPSQKIYARLFHATYIPSQDLINLIKPFRSIPAEPVDFPKTNSFLVTDSLANLQRIQELINRIDVPSDPTEKVRFFQLQRVSAVDLRSRLETLRQGALEKYLGSNTIFEADERTNQLIAITHPSNMEIIENLVEQLDIDVAPLTRSEVYIVKHADAKNVADLIRQVIEGQQSAREQDRDVDTPTAGGERTPQTPQGQQPQNIVEAALGNLEGAALQFSKYVTIVADERSNSIVAYGTPSDLTQIEELIEKIDVLLALVRIEVVIAEVTLTHDQVRGIDSFNITLDPSRLLDTVGEYEFGVQSAQTTRLGSPFNIQGSLRGFSLQTVFDTAKRDNNVRILQHPNITATHNQEASIVVAQSRPIITSTTSELQNPDAVRSQVDFRDIGIELTVTPLIGSNGMIQMEIEQIVESVIDFVEIDGNQQPVIGKREAKSFISVSDQEVIILGGLQETSDSTTESRIAFFGQLPVIGPLFGGRSEEGTRRELVIFIKPFILNPNPEDRTDEPGKNFILGEGKKMRDLKTRQMVDEYFEEEFFAPTPEPEPEEKDLRRGPRR